MPHESELYLFRTEFWKHYFNQFLLVYPRFFLGGGEIKIWRHYHHDKAQIPKHIKHTYTMYLHKIHRNSWWGQKKRLDTDKYIGQNKWHALIFCCYVKRGTQQRVTEKLSHLSLPLVFSFPVTPPRLPPPLQLLFALS